MNDTVSQILEHKIVAILRGVPPEEVVRVARALCDGGISIVEITLNSRLPFEQIRSVSSFFKDRMIVGAGTVLNRDAASSAITSGARLIISPSLNAEVIKYTRQQKCVSIPGAFTATEVVGAFEAGADIVKIFPAQSPQYIKELRGPLDHIPMMPTGGVHLDNIQAFRDAGAVAFGIGSALVNGHRPITETVLKEITSTASRFYHSVHTNTGNA